LVFCGDRSGLERKLDSQKETIFKVISEVWPLPSFSFLLLVCGWLGKDSYLAVFEQKWTYIPR
jgi:hypothetical protein